MKEDKSKDIIESSGSMQFVLIVALVAPIISLFFMPEYSAILTILLNALVLVILYTWIGSVSRYVIENEKSKVKIAEAVDAIEKILIKNK